MHNEGLTHFASGPVFIAAIATITIAFGARIFLIERSHRQVRDILEKRVQQRTRELQRAYALSEHVVQSGNCGSPIETAAGWLVLTHAVGPMRPYCISALLLDLDDPARVIGSLDTPLLVPSEFERNGYVPNVVYSCGALRHQHLRLLPFGIADQSIGIAVANLDDLLDQLVSKQVRK